MILCGVVALAPPLAMMSPAAAAPRVHTVVIDKMAFGPAPSGLRVGDVVLWVNKDMFRHTATARDKSFDVDLAAGASARTVVKRAGTFRYFCRYHPGMIGQMVVAK
jgi:plastocyanin